MQLRIKAALLHLAGSAAVAAIAWWLVFRLWYPPPLSDLAGGSALFVLLVSVDVVIGPALTAVVANPNKPKRELARDLAVILALQLGAFGYGIHAMALARPVALVFEIDLFRVVTAADIEESSLTSAEPGLRQLSWTGPATLAAVKPDSADEQLRTIELALNGIPLSNLPSQWRPYAPKAAAAWSAAKPLSALLARRPTLVDQADAISRKAGVAVSELRTLPLLSRRAEWTVVLANPGARVVGFLSVVDAP